MKTQLLNLAAMSFSMVSARNIFDESSTISDSMMNEFAKINKKTMKIKQSTSCQDISLLPINCFAKTCSYKFTELTYLSIRDLVMSAYDNFMLPMNCGMKYYKRKCHNIECDIYKMLKSVLNTVPPCVFDRYYEAFQKGNYYECFLILQSLFNRNADMERFIIEQIIRRNRHHHNTVITAICFVDPVTKESTVIELPGCVSEKRVCLYLPRHCLKFEEFLTLSFAVDKAIIIELDRYVRVGFKRFYYKVLEKFHGHFKNMTTEQRIMWWLRIKFFVFNSIGYSISHLSTGSKREVYELLIKSVRSQNDAFYLAYARALGLINK